MIDSGSNTRLVITADLGYKPIEHWSESWGISVSTIKSWIAANTCPAKKIGGRWMISQLELLNWEDPEVVQCPSGESERGGNLRAEKKRRSVPARAGTEREKTAWPL